MGIYDESDLGLMLNDETPLISQRSLMPRNSNTNHKKLSFSSNSVDKLRDDLFAKENMIKSLKIKIVGKENIDKGKNTELDTCRKLLWCLESSNKKKPVVDSEKFDEYGTYKNSFGKRPKMINCRDIKITKKFFDEDSSNKENIRSDNDNLFYNSPKEILFYNSPKEILKCRENNQVICHDVTSFSNSIMKNVTQSFSNIEMPVMSFEANDIKFP